MNTKIKNKRTLTGVVVSDKMEKTAVVVIERRLPHPLYKKIIKRTKKIKADTSGFEVKVGQPVKIESTRPISHDKNFKVVEILKGKGKA